MNTNSRIDLSTIDPDYIKVGIIIFIIVLIMSFLLVVLKRLLMFKLKNKILDKGLSEEQTALILQNEDTQHKNVKWMLVSAGMGTGLLIVSYSLPVGVHSLAILAFSLSASFLVYHLYRRRLKK